VIGAERDGIVTWRRVASGSRAVCPYPRSLQTG
jgi:hypothetical protein